MGELLQKPHRPWVALFRRQTDVLQAFLPVLLHAITPIVNFAQEILGIGISLLRHDGEQFQGFLHVLGQEGPLGVGSPQQVGGLKDSHR